jgi:prepilin-type N-terminal cleavage/methylation domain-containing protein
MMTQRPKRGYSLVELIVSLGLFSMVMVVVTGAYLTLISLDRQARASNQLSASLSFAVESMARSMRTGTTYKCNQSDSSPNCGSGGTSISFIDTQGQTITYLLKTNGSIGQCTGGLCTGATAIALTDRRISITSLRFYVAGVGATDRIQPQVTFTLAGTMTTDAGETTNFAVQTSAAQRFLEI